MAEHEETHDHFDMDLIDFAGGTCYDEWAYNIPPQSLTTQISVASTPVDNALGANSATVRTGSLPKLVESLEICDSKAVDEELIDETLTARELLFEFALQVSQSPLTKPPPCLTLLSLITATTDGMVKGQQALPVVLKWFQVVCNLVDLSGETDFSSEQWKEMCQESLAEYIDSLSMTCLRLLLRFIGVELSGRNGIKTPPRDFLSNVTAAIARHIRNRTPIRPLSSALQNPGLVRDLFFISCERNNPERGFLLEDRKEVKVQRPCRFCGCQISQIRRRKRCLKKNIDLCQAGDIVASVASACFTSDSSSCSNSWNDQQFDVNHFYHKRKSFCNSACVFLYRIGASQSCLRAAVCARDQGVCSSCTQDTLAILQKSIRLLEERTRVARALAAERKAFNQVPFEMELVAQVIFDCCPPEWRPNSVLEPADIVTVPGSALGALYSKVSRRLQQGVRREVFRKNPRFGFRPGDVWQADHIVPVVLQGGQNPLTLSFRTLCLVCHRSITQRLMNLKPPRKKKWLEEEPSGDISLLPSLPASDLQPRKLRRKVGRWYMRT
eukprot:Gregarina_sp_Poly_1__3708@NODE_2097_length_2690_cov_38_136866_g1353_i0_p1_GENE_NODE_2097_length_2690_cov_38_136866_g1353_i0NODE_2097_length_2690_cov_38_136866_g1353_i0_p1_ORF_typecomplete_len555_score66_27HNH/PF01844_23/0_0025_NODE_2097_length_2690_cov_38_136866_g1353_i06062270